MGMYRRLRSLSIGAKTLISHITLALVIILLASVLAYTFTYRYVRESHVQNLMQNARHIAVHTGSFSNDELSLPKKHIVSIFQELSDALIFFLDEESEIVRMSQHIPGISGDGLDSVQWVDVMDTIDLEYAHRLLSGEEISVIRQFDFAQDVVMLVGTPIVNGNGEIIGGVVLARPISEFNSLSRTILFIFLLVVSVSLLLATVLSLILSRTLVRPMERITRAARRMANGVYAERITALPNDEIGELGRTLNSMSGRLMDVIRNLRKERDKLELVISNIGEGLIAVDTQWHIVHVNNACLELLEMDSVDSILASEDPDILALREMLTRCMQTGQRERIAWRNPSQRALNAEASTISDEGGNILGTVCLLRDVSEAERMEQLRREYVTNISHELRTPLTGIRGMVEPLIDGIMDTEQERQDSYQVILTETIRLQKLVGEMLDLSRLQDGRIHMELEPMELAGILEAVTRSMRPIAEEADITLEFKTDGSRLECLGNENRITQVLVILLDNALSFTPRGGRVAIRAKDTGECVAVTVADNGCGIEPKDLPFIWERFYKADKSRLRTTGTGLGLSIARQIVTLMGGEISVVSEPGRGTAFTFTLNKKSTEA